MTRKAGVIVVAVLALSVAILGIFLAARCERAKAGNPAPARDADSLLVRNGAPVD
jgi:hypothetical protein